MLSEIECDRMAPTEAMVDLKMQFILNFLQILRFLFIRPILFIVWRERVKFEQKNNASRVDSKSGLTLFEVSSQGEWEQVRPLVLEFLKQSMPVDILYASASVEKEMINFCNSHQLVRVKRLELVTKGSSKAIREWSRAKWIFFCRYDFYPELLLLKKDASLVLLNATLIHKNSFLSILLSRLIYGQFHTIVWSSVRDLERGRRLQLAESIDQRVGDLRPLAILKRLESAEKQLSERGHTSLISYWNSRRDKVDFLLGSAWPTDLQLIFSSSKLLQDLIENRYKLWIAPHKLNQDAIKALEVMKRESPFKDLKVFILNAQNFDPKAIEEAQIVINVIPGILCESYKYFKKVYVGGGYEKGIHSVSEPFYAGAMVAVGPHIYRSTEFEAAKESSPQRIFRITQTQELEQFLTRDLPEGEFVGHDSKVKLTQLRNHLCSLAMSTRP